MNKMSARGIDVNTPVKKPWPLYFMALWAFFGVGSFLSMLGRSVFGEDEQVVQIVSLVALGIAITLAYFLAKFNRTSLIIFGVLSVSVAAFQIFNLISILFTQGYSPVVYFVLYYIVPSLVLAWPAFSKKYRELSSQYASYAHQEAMRKASIKALRQ